ERLNRGDTQLRNVVAMPHGTHGPIRREKQVDILDLRELQECAEFLPGPLFGRQRAFAGHPVVEKAVNLSLLLLRRKVCGRSYANVGEQTLNEHIMRKGVGEKDRVVDHRIIEGVTVRLILQQSFPLNAENLQPYADDRSQEPVATNVIGPV